MRIILFYPSVLVNTSVVKGISSCERPLATIKCLNQDFGTDFQSYIQIPKETDQ